MAKLLDFIVRCNNASYDDVTEDVIKMADPESFETRGEMADYFETWLGYNPMNHFDRRFIEDEYDDLVEEAPYSVQEQLRNKREEIISKTMESLEDVNESVLHKVFLNVIESVVGWKPNDENEVSLDDCITMSIFGEMDIEDTEEDEEDEDDYDDSFDDSPEDDL